MNILRKRKAVTKDVSENDVTVEGGEFKSKLANSIHSNDIRGSSIESEDASRVSSENVGNSDDDSDVWRDGSVSSVDEDSTYIGNYGLEEGNVKTSVRKINSEPKIKRDSFKVAIEKPALSGTDSNDRESTVEIGTDAHGNPRYIYNEINPVYDSDDSDAPETTNTIGNIPLSFYDSFPHIGYNIDGKKVVRPAKGEALDALLESLELPSGWTGLTDSTTGESLQLNKEELQILKRITRNEVPVEGYDPYPDMIEYFSSVPQVTPLSAAPEPKRRFVPSKTEAKRVAKIVKAIKEGRIKPAKQPKESNLDDEEERPRIYDIWSDEAPTADHAMHIPAPKQPPPGYEESYHPPPEYLPDDEEKKDWYNKDPDDRNKSFLPKDHESLRKVAGYDSFVKEKFERCLDLYLAPRVRRNRPDIDPESLLPKLPNPEELKPFPSSCATTYKGHLGRVRCLSINIDGTLLASGGDDGTVRIWELLTGRQLWSAKLSTEEAVSVVRWRPEKPPGAILSAAAGENVYLMVPLSLVSPEDEIRSRKILDAGFGYSAVHSAGIKKDAAGKWTRPTEKQQADGIFLRVSVRSTVKVVEWHRRGDYFVTVSPQGQRSAIAMHTLSKHLTQLPFRRLKGLPQTAKFHPAKPILFVAMQQTVRCYDLSRQELIKTLQPGARWISCVDVHPGGDNVLVGSYDRRLLWHDVDLSSRPYKTLRYHGRAIRAVRFHQGGRPLFADASDDGTVQVFHGKVVSDLMENATVVPLKVLRGHKISSELGVLDLDWHPREPWLVSAGADGMCRLWV